MTSKFKTRFGMTKRQAAKYLRGAAALIEKFGWVRGSYHNKNGYCALGAMNKVVHGAPWASPPSRAEQIASLAICGTKWGGAAFNDHRATNRRDITSRFRKAARNLEHGDTLG